MEHECTLFFFQAEDGIRVYDVTGVQTCALPIFAEKVSNIAIPLFTRSLELASEDSAAFDQVMAAFKMPKDDDEQIEMRRTEIRRATLEAARTPLETARLAFELLSALPELATLGNANAVSDVGVAALLASTACKGALMNVEINLSSLPAAPQSVV